MTTAPLLLKLIIVFTCILCGSNGHPEVRLVGRRKYEGRVEIFHDGKWGTVCDDGWGLYAAGVVCRQLDFGPAIGATGRANYGQGGGTIWLDQVICVGNESALKQCSHNGWGIHDCTHDEDAGAICANDEFTSNNKTLQFSCHITSAEPQLSSEDCKRINNGEILYKTLPATTNLDCDMKKFPTCEVCVVFSACNNTGTSPPATSEKDCNYIKYIIIAVITSLITGILGNLCKIRISDVLKKIMASMRKPKPDDEPDECTQPIQVAVILLNQPSTAQHTSGPSVQHSTPATSHSTSCASNHDQQEVSSTTTGYDSQSANGATEEVSLKTPVLVTDGYDN